MLIWKKLETIPASFWASSVDEGMSLVDGYQSQPWLNVPKTIECFVDQD